MIRRQTQCADERQDRQYSELPGRVGRRFSMPGTPLAETLERVSVLEIGGTNLSARLGVPDEPGWVTTAELAADGGLLDELLDRVGRAYKTDDRAVMGTLFLRGYLWRILISAVAAFLIDRRLPGLGPENVALHFDENGRAAGLAFVERSFAALPADRDAVHSDARVFATEDALLAWLRDQLEGHLTNHISSLRSLRVRRGTRVLWGAAVDVCAEAFMFVGRELRREGEACSLGGRLLAGPSPLSGPTNYFVLEYDGRSELTRVRNTCCLYYKVGDGACFTCPRISNEERLRRLAEEHQEL